MGDICENKHGGNEFSIYAFESFKKELPKSRLKVLSAIKDAGPSGVTVHELADKWGLSPNQISGRFSELKRDGVIFKVGTRKNVNGNLTGAYSVKGENYE